MEIWKDIKDYEGLYQVSNYGRVRSLKYRKTNISHIMSPACDSNGYLGLYLYKDKNRKRFQIHRLVAEYFIPNPYNLSQVNHKDENKLNNTVENLEWCDSKYNVNFGSRNDRVSKKMTNGKRSKQVLQYKLDGSFVREWPSTRECGRNGFNQSVIACCCRNEKSYKTAYGYLWKYKKDVV